MICNIFIRHCPKKLIYLPDIFLCKQIFSFIVENYMDFFGTWSTNIGSKHNIIRRVTIHFFGFNFGKNFNIATTTINVLFMFDLVLQN